MQRAAQAVGKWRDAMQPRQGRKKLIPEVFLVIGHIVLLEERNELLLKRMLFVMLLLSGNISSRRGDV